MSNHLQEQARQHAIKAIEFDQVGDKESAIFYYLVKIIFFKIYLNLYFQKINIFFDFRKHLKL